MPMPQWTALLKTATTGFEHDDPPFVAEIEAHGLAWTGRVLLFPGLSDEFPGLSDDEDGFMLERKRFTTQQAAQEWCETVIRATRQAIKESG